MSFKIGDAAWFANVGQRQVQLPCPVCFGKRAVVLILGDDSRVELPCDYCGKGWNAPTGVVWEYEFRAEPERVIVREIRSNVTAGGSTREYVCTRRHVDTRTGEASYGDSHFKEEELFATEALAGVAAERRAAEIQKEHETRAEYLKKDAKKSFAWNAGYHMREAKRHERDIEYHRKMAVLCKERAKETLP